MPPPDSPLPVPASTGGASPALFCSSVQLPSACSVGYLVHGLPRLLPAAVPATHSPQLCASQALSHLYPSMFAQPSPFLEDLSSACKTQPDSILCKALPDSTPSPLNTQSAMGPDFFLIHLTGRVGVPYRLISLSYKHFLEMLRSPSFV